MKLTLTEKGTLWLMILLVATITSNLYSIINASNGARLTITPQNNVFHTNTTFVYDTFTVNVTVHDIIDLYTWQINVTYDPALLNVTRAFLPDDNVFAGKNSFAVEPILAEGSVLYGATLLGEPLGVDVIEGRLAQLEFQIMSGPPTDGSVSCNLDFVGVADSSETFMLKSPPQDIISIVAESGYYEYDWQPILEPYMEAKPPRYETSHLETFNITVWLNNIVSGHRLVDVAFKLSYNATLMNVTTVLEGPLLSEVGTTTFTHSTDTDNLTIQNYLNPPYANYPDRGGVIATVTFQGIFQDAKKRSCNLELNDIILLDNDTNPISSPPEFTKHSFYSIQPATSQITITAADKVATGSDAIISGAITPTKIGVEVTIYYKTIGSDLWNILSEVVTDDNSVYTYTWHTPTYPGIFNLYAGWSGDNDTQGAESQEIGIEVKYKDPSTITIKIVPGTTVLLGEDVTITGNINPKHTQVTVTIHYRTVGETSWNVLATVETDSESTYSYTWTAPELGKYEVKASWQGDPITSEATSETKTVEIVESIPFDIMTYLPYIAIIIIVALIVIVYYFKKIRS